MKSIDYIVLFATFTGLITDSSFPNRDCFGDADEQARSPATQEQHEERRGLNVGYKGVVGVIDRIKLVIDAVVFVLNI